MSFLLIFVIELFGLIDGFGCEVDLELFEGTLVSLRKYNAGMSFAEGELFELSQRFCRVFVGRSAD